MVSMHRQHCRERGSGSFCSYNLVILWGLNGHSCWLFSLTPPGLVGGGVWQEGKKSKCCQRWFLPRLQLWPFSLYLRRERYQWGCGLGLALSHKGPWMVTMAHTYRPGTALCALHIVGTHLNLMRGLPWWRSGWESACRCRGHGFEPWSGGIPHAVEQLGPWATTTEPARLEPVLRNKRGHDSERHAHRDEEWPPLAAARESPRTETKTQHTQK